MAIEHLSNFMTAFAGTSVWRAPLNWNMFSIVHSHLGAALMMLFLKAGQISLVKSLECIAMAASYIAISGLLTAAFFPFWLELFEHNEHLGLYVHFTWPPSYGGPSLIMDFVWNGAAFLCDKTRLYCVQHFLYTVQMPNFVFSWCSFAAIGTSHCSFWQAWYRKMLTDSLTFSLL